MTELTIKQLVQQAHATAVEKGWHDPAAEPDAESLECVDWLASIMSIAAAGIESVRKGADRDSVISRTRRLVGTLKPASSERSHELVRLTSWLAMIACEVVEAMNAAEEAALAGKPLTADLTGASGKPEGLGSEMADLAIWLADIAALYGIDLDAEIVRKLAFNKTRAIRHGGKVL